jgi:hypothetical protein
VAGGHGGGGVPSNAEREHGVAGAAPGPESVNQLGRLPGERTCALLVWAVLDRQRRGWHGVTVIPRALRHMQDLRGQLFADDVNDVAELDVSSAA